MSITDLVRKTITIINKRGDNITPLLYYDIFCNEARKGGVVAEDCEMTNNYIKKLDADFQRDIKKYNIRTLQEFLAFLVSNLNRLNQNHLFKRHQSLLQLTQKILKAVSLLDNKEVKDLSARTKGLLDRVHTHENLDDMKAEWSGFIVGYRDNYKSKLSPFIDIDSKDDMNDIVDKIVPLLIREQKSRDSRNLIELLFHSAKPSLLNVDETAEGREIEKLYKKVRSNPDLIYDIETQTKLQDLYEKRVHRDREEEVKTVSEFNGIVGSVLESLQDTTESSETVHKNVNEVKNYLGELKENVAINGEKSDVFEKISDRIEDINRHTSDFFNKIKGYSKKIFDLKSRISELESALSKTQEEVKSDFLTKLLNKRGLDSEVDRLEKIYNENRGSYSLVVIDLDHFKKINDKYGHDAGDLILVYFSKILKEAVVDEESVGRYGGEEFLVLLPNIPQNDAIDFAEELRKKVIHTKFIYKNERVDVTFSAGVSHRDNYTSFEDLFQDADKQLYRAKELGRNRVLPHKLVD